MRASKYNEMAGGVTYTSVDFYIRTDNGDVKFRTEDLAMEWACLINRAHDKVIATVVKKITFKMWTPDRRTVIENEVKEFPKSMRLFELYLANGYKTKGGKVI